MRAGNFIDASKALRSAANLSAGTPGVVTIARAMAVSAELADSAAVERAVEGAGVVIHCGAVMKGTWPEHEAGTVRS